MPPVHPASAAAIKSWKSKCHRIHRCFLEQHRSTHIVILVIGSKPFLLHRIHWCYIFDHRCIHIGITQRLCSGLDRKFLIHRCLTKACTGAILSDCTLIQMSTATIWIQCDRIHRCYVFDLSGACDFCAVCSQSLGVLLNSI